MYKYINSDSSDEGTQQHVKEKPGKQPPKSCSAGPSAPKLSPATTTSQYYPKSLSVLDMLKMGNEAAAGRRVIKTMHIFMEDNNYQEFVVPELFSNA